MDRSEKMKNETAGNESLIVKTRRIERLACQELLNQTIQVILLFVGRFQSDYYIEIVFVLFFFL